MRKISIILCSAILVLVSACGSSEKETKKSEVKIVANDVYTVPSNPTTYIAKQYNKLTKALKSGDEEKIAKLVAVNFASDFYTLKNKSSADDIGGITYFPAADQENFKTYALNYVYANYKLIKNDEGESELPVVSKVSVEGISSVDYTYTVTHPADEALGTTEYDEDQNFSAYKVNLTIAYEDTKVSKDDLKTTCSIYIINLDDRLVIASIE